jgi:hypothetical protein
MQKTKLIVKLLIVNLLIAFGLFVKPAYAANISITGLPSYINSNDFKLSYSCLGCTSVQFYVSKHGGSWVAFGPVMTDASGQVQVTSSQIDEETDYVFKVADSGVGEATTSTIYDNSGPSPVSGYYKERIGEGTYKLHWTNPSDSDFAQVIIYRGDSASFSADSGHEIARVSGGAGSPMTYDDNFSSDASKIYYYALRAIDKANNSSGLVGDGGVVYASPAPAVAGAVTGTQVRVVPGGGEVLGGEATPEAQASPASTTGAQEGILGGVSGLSTTKKVIIGLALVLLGVVSYSLLKKRNQ